MEYEVIVGMEVHAQLLTKSKMFCSCSADYANAAPNTHVCPVCMALPGALPVINKAAVEATILTGLALNTKIAERAVFARKNYHYPDLPKGYQISQYELPLCLNGYVEIENDENKPKKIRIQRAHLEEDTGKLVHMGDYSLVDLNRAGVPLLEIVTEADIRSAEEAYRYLTKLRTILRYLGVSTADMEKGAMRCEANISVRPKGQKTFGTKVEVKNLNSFRAVRNAIEYETKRHIAVLESGGRIKQVTMGWNDAAGHTFVQRSKEEANDYRYFPEPDLPPLTVSREWVAEIAQRLPELPDAKAKRFSKQYGLNAANVAILTSEQAIADWYEAAVNLYPKPKVIVAWFVGELFGIAREKGLTFQDGHVSPQNLVALLKLIANGTINRNTGKKVLAEMFDSGKAAQKIVADHGWAQVSDDTALTKIVGQIIVSHPAEVAKYRAGKKSLIGWFMGQVMSETRGKANPDVVRKLLRKILEQADE